MHRERDRVGMHSLIVIFKGIEQLLPNIITFHFRYELAKAQVEQGKMLLEEDSLKKKEELLKIERAAQAEARSRKEQQYADKTVKNMHSQQR